MNTFTLSLAGKEYQVKELPTRKNSAYREKLRAPYEALVDIVSFFDLDLSDPTVVSTGFDKIVVQLGEQVGLLLDLLYEYSSVLADDRDHIEENSTETEVLTAFVELLKRVFPADFLLTAMSEAQKLGLQARRTSTNSPLPPGESGPTNSTKSS